MQNPRWPSLLYCLKCCSRDPLGKQRGGDGGTKQNYILSIRTHSFYRLRLFLYHTFTQILSTILRYTRDGTAESVSRNRILRRERGQVDINFPCSADHEQDWQPYQVDPFSCDVLDHTYIQTYIHTNNSLGVGKGAHKSWFMVKPEKAATRYCKCLEDC